MQELASSSSARDSLTTSSCTSSTSSFPRFCLNTTAGPAASRLSPSARLHEHKPSTSSSFSQLEATTCFPLNPLHERSSSSTSSKSSVSSGGKSATSSTLTPRSEENKRTVRATVPTPCEACIQQELSNDCKTTGDRWHFNHPVEWRSSRRRRRRRRQQSSGTCVPDPSPRSLSSKCDDSRSSRSTRVGNESLSRSSSSSICSTERVGGRGGREGVEQSSPSPSSSSSSPSSPASPETRRHQGSRVRARDGADRRRERIAAAEHENPAADPSSNLTPCPTSSHMFLVSNDASNGTLETRTSGASNCLPCSSSSHSLGKGQDDGRIRMMEEMIERSDDGVGRESDDRVTAQDSLLQPDYLSLSQAGDDPPVIPDDRTTATTMLMFRRRKSSSRSRPSSLKMMKMKRRESQMKNMTPSAVADTAPDGSQEQEEEEEQVEGRRDTQVKGKDPRNNSRTSSSSKGRIRGGISSKEIKVRTQTYRRTVTHVTEKVLMLMLSPLLSTLSLPAHPA